MSKSEKILNYIAMACTVISAIIFFIGQNWYAALWALLALLWIVYNHLVKDSYYNCKKILDKLTDDYFNTLIRHEKEVRELKNEIIKLREKGE